MVSLEEFEAKYQAFAANGKDQYETPKVANRKAAVTSVAGGTLEKGDGKEEQAMPSNDGAKKDIGFRIEPSVEETTCVAPAPPKQLLASSGVDERSLRFAKQFLDHVAIIFPSAVKHIGSNSNVPTVLIRPTFFATSNNDEELFLALEGCANAQVLSNYNVTTSNDGLHWLRRLSGGENAAHLVPLYILMLARIEAAIGKAYRSTTRKNEQEPGKNSKRIIIEKKTMEPKAFLGEVFSYCRSVGDLTLAIDASTLSGFVAPLADACRLKASFETGKVENLIMTPLLWVLAASAQHQDYFAVLDKAVAQSLQKMLEHGSTADLEVSMATSIAASSPAQPSKQTKAGAGNGSHKKKKKKSKKRKVGC